jgi:uncharacterized protein (TIGR03435 family)
MVTAPVVTFISTEPADLVPAISAGTAAGMPEDAAPFASLPTGAPSARFTGVMTWLVVGWIAGVSLFSIRLIGGCVVAARMRFVCVLPPPSEWQRAFDSLRVRLRIPIGVKLLISELVSVPTVIGWLKPVVLLPAAALTGIAPEHIEVLLTHELAHIRRHDYLVNLLQRFAETLLFYHPAVWWLSHQMSAEREACCDDIAVSLTGDSLAYVCALASLESRRPEHLAVAANGGSLKDRVSRLLGQSSASTGGLPGIGLLAMGLTVCGLVAQVVDTRPAFEVASLKADKSTTGVDRIQRSGGSLIIVNVSLKRLIGMAYGVEEGRDYLFKGPDWIDAENFDISAKFPPETSEAKMLEMLQRLLDERFRLKLHKEPREFAVYALVADPRGAKVLPSKTPGPFYRFSARGGHAVGSSVTMAQFADRLSREDFQIGRRVVDFTGLPGTYDLTLDWENSDAASDRPTIFSALREQLGLRLEPRKVSLDVLVVDSVLRAPVAN